MRSVPLILATLLLFLAGCGGAPLSDLSYDTAGDLPSVDIAGDLPCLDTCRDIPRTDLSEACSGDCSFDTVFPDGHPADNGGDATADTADDSVADAADDVRGPGCPSIPTAVTLGSLADTPLDEISGLAASRLHPGILWGHNDSGDVPRIFAVRTASPGSSATTPLQFVEFAVAGGVIGRNGEGPVRSAVAVDWEDIAIGPFDGLAGDAIFIADTGDNSYADPERRRPYLRILVMPEPREIPAEGGKIGLFRSFRIVYGDEPHDCEAFFVDPWTGDLYLVEKQHLGETAGVYRVPAAALSGDRSDAVLVASRIATIDVALATGADMSADGTMLAIRNYGGAPDGVKNNGLLYFRTSGMTVEQMLSAPSCPLPNFAAEPWFEVQGEAIAFKPDNTGLFTVCERNVLCSAQELHFWELNP